MSGESPRTVNDMPVAWTKSCRMNWLNDDP